MGPSRVGSSLESTRYMDQRQDLRKDFTNLRPNRVPATISLSMETSRIAELLQPFVAEPLSDSQLHSISAHLDLLLRWNARMNLTAVRDKDNIVTRHFGESLFAARQLFPAPTQPAGQHLIDIGSGAGFPGLPIKLWNPALKTTLIESNHKKATFLREVVRSLSLGDVEVLPIRSEDYKGAPADVVTLRAVERFEFALPTAATLVRLKGGSPSSSEKRNLRSQQNFCRVSSGEPPRQSHSPTTAFSWSDPLRNPMSKSESPKLRGGKRFAEGGTWNKNAVFREKVEQTCGPTRAHVPLNFLT